MLQLSIDHVSVSGEPEAAGEFGVWSGYDIPQNPTGWHPLARQLYEYWRRIAPPGRLPQRRDLVPEEIAPLWSRAWMLDVFRNPLRYRYRLCGTERVRSIGRDVTGKWLDDVHPGLIANPEACERLRFVAETGVPTWRRGRPLWTHDPRHEMIESCIVPLAEDGCTVDKLLGVSVLFDRVNRRG